MDKFVSRKSESRKSGEWMSAAKKPRSQPPPPHTASSTSKEKAVKKKAVKKEAKSQDFPSISTSHQSGDIPDDCRRIAKSLWTPKFKAEYEEMSLKSFDKEKATKMLKAKKPLKKESQIHEAPSTSRRSDIPDDCKKILKSLWTPKFRAEYEQIALKSFDKEKDASELKAKGGVLRNVEARAKLMHGYDCRCCAPYYDALNLSPGERQRRVNQVSRHRAFEPIPTTPERYWDVKFPQKADRVETDSPLFKRDKRSAEDRRKVAKRKIFDSNSFSLKSESI